MTKKTAAKLIREDEDDDWVAHTSQWREEAVEVMESQMARIAELEAKLDAALAPKPAAYPELVAHSSIPWYPDDSGEWVEVPEDLEEMPSGLPRQQVIEVLFRKERDAKEWTKGLDAEAYMWKFEREPSSCLRIVAYKVVKP